MAKSLKELRAKIKPEVQAKARAKAIDILMGMSLAETRKFRNVSQSALADRLGIAQSNISKIEARSDVLLSTLQQYVEALGGTLEIHAKFPDGQDVKIALPK